LSADEVVQGMLAEESGRLTGGSVESQSRPEETETEE